MAQFEILLSQAKAMFGDFDAAVAEFIKAKKDHQKTIGEAAPAAHPFIERAVSVIPGSIEDQRPDSFVANYKIIDDTPSLDDRKTELANAATAAANAAIDAISPPLKRRLWELQHADAARMEVPDDRAKEVIAQHEARQDKVQAIYRQLAQAHSDIHDLTAENFDHWLWPAFGG